MPHWALYLAFRAFILLSNQSNCSLGSKQPMQLYCALTINFFVSCSPLSHSFIALSPLPKLHTLEGFVFVFPPASFSFLVLKWSSFSLTRFIVYLFISILGYHIVFSFIILSLSFINPSILVVHGNGNTKIRV